MSERSGRPRDALAFHYGIVLPDDVAERLDSGVTRVAERLPALVLHAPPKQPGFVTPRIRAPKDE